MAVLPVVELPIEKKSAEASPSVDKKESIDLLRALMTAVPVHQPVAPEYPKPQIPVDQPDYYSEPTVNYD